MRLRGEKKKKKKTCLFRIIQTARPSHFQDRLQVQRQPMSMVGDDGGPWAFVEALSDSSWFDCKTPCFEKPPCLSVKHHDTSHHDLTRMEPKDCLGSRYILGFILKRFASGICCVVMFPSKEDFPLCAWMFLFHGMQEKHIHEICCSPVFLDLGAPWARPIRSSPQRKLRMWRMRRPITRTNHIWWVLGVWGADGWSAAERDDWRLSSSWEESQETRPDDDFVLSPATWIHEHDTTFDHMNVSYSQERCSSHRLLSRRN